MNYTHCPDCSTPLSAKTPDRCRCGWAKPVDQPAAPARVLVPCELLCGRAGRRVGLRIICDRCEEAERELRVESFRRANGLRSRDDCIAYCKRLARSFGRGPTFDRWAENIKQPAVDFFVRDASKGSVSALERLREAGVIDGRNQVIPPGEAREIARDIARQERARQIAQVQQELEARRVKENAFEEGATS